MSKKDERESLTHDIDFLINWLWEKAQGHGGYNNRIIRFDEEEKKDHRFQCLERWLKIRETETGILSPFHPFAEEFALRIADIWHSALLCRLIAGKEPLPEPPPCSMSYPWYSLVEAGRSAIWELHGRSAGNVTINQIRWIVSQETSDSELICWYPRHSAEWRVFNPQKDQAKPEWFVEISQAPSESALERGRHLHNVRDARDRGIEGIPELRRFLNDPWADVRQIAALTLGNLMPDASIALSDLAEALRDPDHEVKALASRALGFIGENALPVLIEALNEESKPIRFYAASAIKSIGPPALEAQDLLETLIRDCDEKKEHLLHMELSQALRSIRGRREYGTI